MKDFDARVQVKADSYRKRIGITNFINASCQIQDCLELEPRNVLIIGKGLGLEPSILRGMGIEVTVADIDEKLDPDYVCSVSDLSIFQENQFDVVIAAHVLEHLPFEMFEKCMMEISRIGRHAIIYLPFACIVPEIRLAIEPIFRKTIRLCIPLFLKEHKFNGEHYWELGTKGFSVKKIRTAICKYMKIKKEYHNWDWRYSYNFVLSKT